MICISVCFSSYRHCMVHSSLSDLDVITSCGNFINILYFPVKWCERYLSHYIHSYHESLKCSSFHVGAQIDMKLEAGWKKKNKRNRTPVLCGKAVLMIRIVLIWISPFRAAVTNNQKQYTRSQKSQKEKMTYSQRSSLKVNFRHKSLASSCVQFRHWDAFHRPARDHCRLWLSIIS